MKDDPLNVELSKVPFAEFLEEGCKQLFELKPRSIALLGILKNGKILAGYYQCSEQDKGILAHTIQEDSFFDALRNNPDILREILDGEEDANE